LVSVGSLKFDVEMQQWERLSESGNKSMQNSV
jgi:hypothetical protein